MDIILDFLKSLWAAYKAKRAAKAAAELPQGAAAVSQIEADGKTIQAQLDAVAAAAKSAAR